MEPNSIEIEKEKLILFTKVGAIVLTSLLLLATSIHFYPQTVATLNTKLGQGIAAKELPIYCVDKGEEKKIALSFDAAWGNEDTAKILEILKKNNVRVTFFMTGGWIEKYPDEVTGVAAQNYLGSGTIKDDADSKNYANVNIDGITPEYLEYMKLEMHAGRNLTKADNQGKKRVCLIADTMAERYFAGKDPIGETLSVATSDGGIFDFVVVGVYVYNQALFGKVDTSIPEKDRVTELMIPLQTCFKLQGTDRTGYDYFNLMIDPLADVNQATTDVLSYFDEMYANNKNFHVSAYNMASDLGMINTVLNVITIAVSGIAAISLIVGGVGVMNIMLVSITERTREIGVRMALGAKRRTIRMQFVIEAIMLCLIGGIIGILIGIGIGALLGKVAGFVIQNMYSQYANYIIMTVHPSVTAIMLSLFFSMLTGVFFGYYPANKASKMEVIDALRYE